MKRLNKSFIGFLSGVAGVITLAVIFHFTLWSKEAEPAIKVENTPVNREAKLGASFAPVVKKVAPSVVSIYSTHIIHIRPMRNPFFADPFFRQFIPNQFLDNGQERIRRKQDLGSGVIISTDGYILTANHVVEGADEIKISVSSNKKEYTARVVGTDPLTDVAVLKIDAQNLPAVQLADSDQLEIGDIILAIGNPYGLSQTVTMGIVSALGRSGLGFNGYEDFIQTDAAINPGNSGGALVDTEGRLVGINTAIYPNSNGGNQGIGFAVPINMARQVMERLIVSGKVTRGNLPILLQDITPRLAQALDLSNQNGVLVSDVFPDTSAEKAGIKSGDVLVSFNGKEITDVHGLQLAISECAPGSSATLKLLHKGHPETVTVTLTELPGNAAAGDSDQKKPGSDNSMIDSLSGVKVADLEPEVRRQLGAPPAIRGALVSEIEQASNAAAAGLQQYDLILEIDRQPVSNSADAVRLGLQAKGDQILLKIWRRQGSLAGTCYLSVDNTRIGK